MKRGLKIILGCICFVSLGVGYILQPEPRLVYVETPEPYPVHVYHIVEVPKPYPVEVVRTVEVPVELKEFNSEYDLAVWLANNRPPKKDGWYCVDYALELQRRAIQQRYQMSTECLIKGDRWGGESIGDTWGNQGHMINSTIIGNEIYFVDPRAGMYWLGGYRGT